MQALLGDPTLVEDPVLAAQAVLGDLATVWREQPVPGLQPDGTETVRGIAVAMPAALPPGIWAPLIRRLAEAPFLHPTPAATFVEQVNPVQPPATVIPSLERFPRDYVDAIRDQRRNVAGTARCSQVDPARSPRGSIATCSTPKPAIRERTGWGGAGTTR